MPTYLTHSKSETQALGKRLAADFEPGTVVTFTGDLGAGKTTLIQGMLEELGAVAPYPSPTFVIMNQYELPEATAHAVRRVYHADAYRVGAADFERLGFAEWCSDPEGLVLLEWPERIASLLPNQRIEITLRALSETEREIRVDES